MEQRIATEAETEREEERRARAVDRKWARIDDQGEEIVLLDIERFCEHIDALGDAAYKSGRVRAETCGHIEGIVCAARQFLTAQAQRRYLKRETAAHLADRNARVIAENATAEAESAT